MFLCFDCCNKQGMTPDDFQWRSKSAGNCENCGKLKTRIDWKDYKGKQSGFKVPDEVVKGDLEIFGVCYIERDDQGNERRINPLKLMVFRQVNEHFKHTPNEKETTNRVTN